GASVTYHDPHVPSFRAGGADLTSVALDDLLGSSDLVVVVTRHRAVDWAAVYGRAGLVVDTVNSSAGRSLRERQVLRLGSGWLPPSPASRAASATPASPAAAGASRA